MESDTMLPPPNPDEPFVAPSVGEAAPTPRRSRALWLIPVALVVIGGAVLAGRLTTSGARSALGDERDSLLRARDGLQTRVAELEGEALRFQTAEEEYVSTIESLKSAVAANEVDMTVLREQAEANSQRIATLEADVADIEQCRTVSSDADAALATWEVFFDRFLDYLDTEIGSEAEAQAEQKMNEADVAIDDAEAALLKSATRCESALDAIP